MTAKAHVLIVDDDSIVGQTFSRMLSVSGYEVTVVRSVDEAMESASSRVPDVILTDPWFRSHWAFIERPGVRVADLPRLAAILGCHGVFDHWQIEALAAYPHKDVPVRVATQAMRASAERVGFTDVRVKAGERVRLETPGGGGWG